MIILALRMPWAILRGYTRSRLDPLEESVVPMRVLPNDLDLYLHMNNGRYQTVMDLGRADYGARTGMLSGFFRRRWQPVAGSATIRYRRPLGPLQSYDLHTRLLGWRGQWWFFDQRLVADGKLAAQAYIKVTVLEAGKPVPGTEVAAELGWDKVKWPTLPDGLTHWLESDAA